MQSHIANLTRPALAPTPLMFRGYVPPSSNGTPTPPATQPYETLEEFYHSKQASKNPLQDRLNAIAQEMEGRYNDPSYAIGRFLRSAYDGIASRVGKFTGWLRGTNTPPDVHSSRPTVQEECLANSAFRAPLSELPAETRMITAWPITPNGTVSYDGKGDDLRVAAFLRSADEPLFYTFDRTSSEIVAKPWLTPDDREVLSLCASFSPVKRQAIREILNEASQVSRLTWKEASTAVERQQAVSITECDWGNSGLVGYGPSRMSFTCGSAYGRLTDGIIAINSRFTTTHYAQRQVVFGIAPRSGIDHLSASKVILHEAAHIMGLGHPIISSGTSGDRFDRMITSEDLSQLDTVMSYTNVPNKTKTPSVAENPLTYSKMDIRALQHYYGERSESPMPIYQIPNTLPQGPGIFYTIASRPDTLSAADVTANVVLALGDHSGAVFDNTDTVIKPVRYNHGGMSYVTAHPDFSPVTGLARSDSPEITAAALTSYMSVAHPEHLTTAIAGKGCNVLKGNNNPNTFHIGEGPATITPFLGITTATKEDVVYGFKPATDSLNFDGLTAFTHYFSIDRSNGDTTITQSYSPELVNGSQTTNNTHTTRLKGYTGPLTSCHFNGNRLRSGGSDYNSSSYLLPPQPDCPTLKCTVDLSRVSLLPKAFGAHVIYEPETPHTTFGSTDNLPLAIALGASGTLLFLAYCMRNRCDTATTQPHHRPVPAAVPEVAIEMAGIAPPSSEIPRYTDTVRRSASPTHTAGHITASHADRASGSRSGSPSLV